jgi:hypothetical protein
MNILPNLRGTAGRVPLRVAGPGDGAGRQQGALTGPPGTVVGPGPPEQVPLRDRRQVPLRGRQQAR